MLKKESVCGRHFVSGRPAKNWDRHNIDWAPMLQLSKTSYREKDHEAAEKRAERVRESQIGH